MTFRVDAYPDEEFEGRVSQIRLEPIVVENVVTYATQIEVPNPDLKLKPGMTATVTLEIARRDECPADSERRPSVQTNRGHVCRTEPPGPRAARRQRRAAGAQHRRGSGRWPRRGRRPRGWRRRRPRATPADARALPEHVGRKSAPKCDSSLPDAAGEADAVTGAVSAGRPTAASAAIDGRQNRSRPPNVAPRQSTRCSARCPLRNRKVRCGSTPAAGSSGRGCALGVTDGAYTELLGPEVPPGTELVTNITMTEGTPTRPTGATSSPLIPQRGFRRR